MRELNQEEILDISGGALFGAIVGGIIGGVLGSALGPIGAVAASTLGAGLMSAIEDRVNK
jgi:outer membrane lipoprotein SlyB